MSSRLFIENRRLFSAPKGGCAIAVLLDLKKALLQKSEVLRIVSGWASNRSKSIGAHSHVAFSERNPADGSAVPRAAILLGAELPKCSGLTPNRAGCPFLV